jgi:hypothetical protein
MKRLLSVTLALGLAAASGAAQTPSRPTLVLTIFAGASTGNALWDVERQPFCVLQGSGSVQSCSTIYDTLRLTRDVTSSLIAGAGATYFAGPHLGYTAEIFYLGLPLDDGCTGVFFNVDPQADPNYGGRNEQLCLNISQASLSTSAVAFFGGVTLRAGASKVVSPYVRGSIGIVTYTSGTIEMSGVFVDGGNIQGRAVYVDNKPKQTAFSQQVAGGFTVRLGPGYQFRFELRDVVVPLKRVTGPSDDFLRPPTTTKTFHHVALTFGLDVILEQGRTRRY